MSSKTFMCPETGLSEADCYRKVLYSSVWSKPLKTSELNVLLGGDQEGCVLVPISSFLSLLPDCHDTSNLPPPDSPTSPSCLGPSSRGLSPKQTSPSLSWESWAFCPSEDNVTEIKSPRISVCLSFLHKEIVTNSWPATWRSPECDLNLHWRIKQSQSVLEFVLQCQHFDNCDEKSVLYIFQIERVGKVSILSCLWFLIVSLRIEVKGSPAEVKEVMEGSQIIKVLPTVHRYLSMLQLWRIYFPTLISTSPIIRKGESGNYRVIINKRQWNSNIYIT